uniref:RNA-dependent RNA polymerase n=1 Tax=Chaetoceros debilis TaxID=122233 RepID=A0A7S3PZY2_9STRA|mmetsp:Transcript_20322/g.30834  ORF Transcript_20322/g.30834 Transcript_20322/m.30834 type:complete len:1325 (+) Transcript_20322:122-4096(+)
MTSTPPAKKKMDGSSSSGELRVVTPLVSTHIQLEDITLEEYKAKVMDAQLEIDSIQKVKEMEADVQTQKKESMALQMSLEMAQKDIKSSQAETKRVQEEMAALTAAYVNLESEYNRVVATSSGKPNGNGQSNGSITSEGVMPMSSYNILKEENSKLRADARKANEAVSKMDGMGKKIKALESELELARELARKLAKEEAKEAQTAFQMERDVHQKVRDQLNDVTLERDQLQNTIIRLRDASKGMHIPIPGHRVTNITLSSIASKPENFLEWIFRDELYTVDKNFTTAEQNERLPSKFSDPFCEAGVNWHVVAAKQEEVSNGKFGKSFKITFYCVRTRGSLDDVNKKLLKYGDFASLTERKAMSRMELLLSPANKELCTAANDKYSYVRKLPASDFELVEERGHVGCGFICEDYLRDLLKGPIKKKITTSIQIRAFIPSIGISKGMLMKLRSKKLLKGRAKIQLPVSMLKVKASRTEGSDPNAYLIICKAGLDPSDYCRDFAKMDCIDPDPLIQPAPSFKAKDLSDDLQRLFKSLGVNPSVVTEYARNRRAPNHACLRGVADPTSKIPPGSVFLTGFKNEKTLKDSIFITRNPCIKTSDGCLLKVVTAKPIDMSDEDYEWLKTLAFGNVIFGFPTKGKKPIPEMIANGDLDGDRYFVCWDAKILSGIDVNIVSDIDVNILSDELVEEDCQISSESVVTKNTRDSNQSLKKRESCSWLKDLQDRLTNYDTYSVGPLVGLLYKASERMADADKVLFMRNPDAEVFADAYYQAIDNAKHGVQIVLPAHLWKEIKMTKLHVSLRTKEGIHLKMRIQKEFDGILHSGTVEKYIYFHEKKESCFTIRYDDEDKEDLTYEELLYVWKTYGAGAKRKYECSTTTPILPSKKSKNCTKMLTSAPSKKPLPKHCRKEPSRIPAAYLKKRQDKPKNTSMSAASNSTMTEKKTKTPNKRNNKKSKNSSVNRISVYGRQKKQDDFWEKLQLEEAIEQSKALIANRNDTSKKESKPAVIKISTDLSSKTVTPEKEVHGHKESPMILDKVEMTSATPSPFSIQNNATSTILVDNIATDSQRWLRTKHNSIDGRKDADVQGYECSNLDYDIESASPSVIYPDYIKAKEKEDYGLHEHSKDKLRMPDTITIPAVHTCTKASGNYDKTEDYEFRITATISPCGNFNPQTMDNDEMPSCHLMGDISITYQEVRYKSSNVECQHSTAAEFDCYDELIRKKCKFSSSHSVYQALMSFEPQGTCLCGKDTFERCFLFARLDKDWHSHPSDNDDSIYNKDMVYDTNIYKYSEHLLKERTLADLFLVTKADPSQHFFEVEYISVRNSLT